MPNLLIVYFHPAAHHDRAEVSALFPEAIHVDEHIPGAFEIVVMLPYSEVRHRIYEAFGLEKYYIARVAVGTIHGN